MRASPVDLGRFAERYLLALEVASKEQPERGTNGLELEWNLLDSAFRPLQKVGAGPDERSFVDVMCERFLPDWLADRHQLEVFHWMIEWATRPYASPVGAVYEARLLEACLINALDKVGRLFGERLYTSHGNLPCRVSVDHRSIPGGWGLAKRRYLQRCVDIYGESLATAGLHASVSLPEPLLSWDFMHLSPTERGDQHLDQYKNWVYIEGTRRMRAFAALFIAVGASTPMRPEVRDGDEVLVLTEVDSIRNLTFPNPEIIDLPDLYRTHADYIRLSTELVRRGIRFGNNNWTPARARSFVEPVERLIAITGEQLHALYRDGLYAMGEAATFDEMAHQIEVQNLLARIDIPMARVEVRTDDGGCGLRLEIANLALKDLLLIRFYADPAYAHAFRYDAEDLGRARRNEQRAAADGLRADIEHPLTGRSISMREFLRQTLEGLRPLAEALGRWELLTPLVELAMGAPNTSEQLRARIRREADDDVVPVELLKTLAGEREAMVVRDVEHIAADISSLGVDVPKLQDLLWRARVEARRDPEAPIRFRPAHGAVIAASYADKTAEILDLAQQLVRIASVTNAPPSRQRHEEVDRAATLIYDYLQQAGLEVHIYEGARYPAVLTSFRGRLEAPVMLCGHFDVVEPDPDETQFEPRVDGDYLLGRGAADMKTVVATYMVWMKDLARRGEPYPGINLLLIGNEEIGEGEPTGTPHVLADLRARLGYAPALLIAGERTGERGDERMGQICVENRGLMRLEVVARNAKGHTGIRATHGDLSARLFEARERLDAIFKRHLTLHGEDDWVSQTRFPFIRVGEPGVYNVTAELGVLGVEARPIPQDSLPAIISEAEAYCSEAGLTLEVIAAEDGVACDLDNPYLQHLIDAVRGVSGMEPELSRKLPGTSARFAPGGQGVVWGQTGIGPHAPDERHFIPSIEPYYLALEALAERMRT